MLYKVPNNVNVNTIINLSTNLKYATILDSMLRGQLNQCKYIFDIFYISACFGYFTILSASRFLLFVLKCYHFGI